MAAFLASRHYYHIKRSETWSTDSVRNECMDYVRQVNKEDHESITKNVSLIREKIHVCPYGDFYLPTVNL